MDTPGRRFTHVQRRRAQLDVNALRGSIALAPQGGMPYPEKPGRSGEDFMRFVAVAMVAVLLSSGCANLLTPSTNAAARWAAQAKAREAREGGRLKLVSNPNDKKLCKEMPVIGSNMRKRVCSSESEWESYDTAERLKTEDIKQSSGNYGNVTSQGEAGATAN
jgi:hypothetical protein